MTRTATGVRTSLPVTGMTCASCETRIERLVFRVDDVESVVASSRRGRVDVVWRGQPDEAALEDAVSRAGYRVGRPPVLSHDVTVWRTFAVGMLAVALLAWAAAAAGWSRLSSGVGDLESGGLMVVLLLGLAAGVSSCMALTGGLVLGISAAHVAERERSGVPRPARLVSRLRPVIVFNVGRIVGFAALGACLGLLGSSVQLPTGVLAAMMLVVAVVMGALAVRLTDISPRASGLTFSLPSAVADQLGLDRRAGRRYTDARALALGAATFFLPCGFTQAAQIYALSTGSPGQAGAIMGVFALGTAPGLLTLGGLPELVPDRGRVVLLRMLGVLVLLFAVINGAAGLRLAGFDLSGPEPPGATVSSNVDVAPTVQILHTVQVTDGYVPVRSTVYAGLPIRWVVDSRDPQSCAVALRAPSVGVSVNLVKGLNTIELPAQAEGGFTFACSMGMYGGSVSAVPRPAP